MKQIQQILWDIWNWFASAIGWFIAVTGVVALLCIPVTIIGGCIWLWIKMFGGM